MIINFTEKQLKKIRRLAEKDFLENFNDETRTIINKINAELITLKHEKLMREKMKENWNCMREVR